MIGNNALKSKVKDFNWKVFFALLGIGILIIALLGKNYHDYAAYIRHWIVISEGGNPYLGKASDNAYGIIYNLFAYTNISAKVALPRVLWILFYFLSLIGLKSFLKESTPNFPTRSILVFLLVNPLFLIFGVKYGSNDVFLASLVLLGVLLYLKKKHILSGIMIALAIGFKFIPLLIAPFLIFQNTLKINLKFLISVSLALALIFFIGYLEWGDNIIKPLIFGKERISKIFSIFRFLRAQGINLDSCSTISTVFSVVLSFSLYIVFKLDRMILILFCWFNILLLYKVGHPQFYLTPLLLGSLVFVLNHKIIEQSRLMLFCIILLGMWLFFWPFYYDNMGISLEVRDWIGLPHSIILLTTNISLLKLAFIKRNLLKGKHAIYDLNQKK
ncbi:MAG: glycosyltransferase 87 family protein [Bacteroidota bacterium]